MKIDNALQHFTETYNRDAIQSIEDISKDFGLTVQRHEIKAIALRESFDRFDEYLRGYGNYVIENKDNPKAVPQESLNERVEAFIGTCLFEEKNIRYPELPSFVQGYVEGVQALLETVDAVKSHMMDADVAQESVGVVNDFVDSFMDKLQESFDPVMDRILWASGYNARQRMSQKEKVQPKPVFL